MNDTLAARGSTVETLLQEQDYIGRVDNAFNKATIKINFWRQRMKESWIAEGDFPTKLLYTRVRVRKKKNEILTLKDQDGNWAEDQHLVKELVVDSLKEVFNYDRPISHGELDIVLRELDLPQITSIQSANLVRPFLDSEIKTAMFAMENSKSPSPDGFTTAFYKLHWNIVGDSVCAAVKSFFTIGFLLKEWNYSLLVMIPKRDITEEVGHLRPISLCNTIYKCASKCMVARMKSILLDIISQSHQAFISGRFMTHNILFSHELIEKINQRRRGQGYLASVKIDMSKAYDRVHWDFLLHIHRSFGFPSQWIQLIHQFISTISYKVLINGDTSDQFRPNCGIRQGDALSPFLFLFCMDIFSRMLQIGTDIRQFQGIKLTRGCPEISHIFFADDALLFFRAMTDSCSSVTNIVNSFCGISGQQLNLQKSHFKVSPNTPMEEQRTFKDLLGMEMFIVDKVAAKVTSWNTINLSQSQKLILINSVLIPMASHVLSCLEVPISVASKVDGIFTRFFGLKNANLIGNGRKVVACRDRWVYGQIPEYKSEVHLCNVRKWKASHFILPLHAGWNHQRINESFVFHDACRIVGMELPVEDKKDFLYWRYHVSGNFTVKTSYTMLDSEDVSQLHNDSNSELYTLLWSMDILPKWKLLFWKIFHKGLATKVNLNRRGIELPVSCDYCASEAEGHQHIFRFCVLAQQVWRGGSLAIHLETEETTSFMDCTIWALWIARNNRVFRGDTTNITTVLVIIKEGADKQGFLKKNKDHHLSFLHPPEIISTYPPGFCRIIISNTGAEGAIDMILVDGSWHNHTRNAGMGWYLEGQQENVHRILGGAASGTTFSALHLESLACLYGLRWAVHASFHKVTILIDSQSLVEMVIKEELIDVHLLWTVPEIKMVGKTFQWCSIQKVDRCRVQRAHDIAKGASTTL
ncbi:uncharacterized protein [Spinacia oleracea]|uniref:Reverse transcriptase domain-containing protein n=1 Tax=Spinacia oleracea TaxID=3562 RepID=A0ABM3RQ09_SPIOL|nr:uncharacterized protein LOC110795475 [Spinacia oleracea]